MKNNQQKNRPLKHKSGNVFTLLIWAVLFLYLLTQLPIIQWNGFSTKSVDLFSDIRVDEPMLELPGETDWQDEESDSLFLPQEPEVLPEVTSPDTTIARPVEQPQVRVPIEKIVVDTVFPDDPPRVEGDVTLFEDFSPNRDGLSHLLAAIQARDTLSRPVRIAFLGDSFIEADIFTQDVRSLLQSRYGGRGVGYMAMHSDFPGFRRSVVQSDNGWSTYSVLKPKEADWKILTAHQQYFVPLEGARSTFKGTTRVERAESWSLSRFLFVARQDCEVELKLSDGEWQSFSVTGSPRLQALELAGETASFQVRMGNVPDFAAIGVWLDDSHGVAVDNISTRGYAGLSLVSISRSRSAQMDEFVPYDAIVLQYGLNIITPEILRYESYARKMVAVINHLKTCYPRTDIILMGVGDRSQKINGDFTTMPAVVALSKAQRAAARQAGVVFWDTYQAMGGHNGMLDYVAHQQANKDYTHINHKGGKRLATEFVKSLQQAMNP